MAVSLGEGVVRISADLAPLRIALVSARYQISSFVAGTRSLGQVAGFLGANFLVASMITLTRAFIDANQAAASMGETINKVNVIFGESGKAVKDFANEMANSLGFVKSELLDATARFGAMGRGAGMAAKDAAEFAIEFAKLAIDMKSTENVPFLTAVEKIQAGLTGQIKPLRDYGILMSADMVKQEAYRLGIAKTGAKLTEQQKIFARASLEFKKAKFMEGDASKTAMSLQNQEAAAMGRLANVMEQFGETMEPIWYGIVSGFNNAMKALQGFFNNNKAGLSAWAEGAVKWFEYFQNGFASAIDYLRPIFTSFGEFFGQVWEEIRSEVSAALGALGSILKENSDYFDEWVLNQTTMLHQFTEGTVYAINVIARAIQVLWTLTKPVIPFILEAINVLQYVVITFFVLIGEVIRQIEVQVSVVLGLIKLLIEGIKQMTGADLGVALDAVIGGGAGGPGAAAPGIGAIAAKVKPVFDKNAAKGGKFAGAEEDAAENGTKGSTFMSFDAFYEKLQAGSGDIEKKQLGAQEEGNKILNEMLARMKAAKGMPALAGGP